MLILFLYSICLFVYTFILISNPFYTYLFNIASNVFLLLEFMVFTCFIRRHLKNDNSSRLMLFLFQLFPLTVCYVLIYNNSIGMPQSNILSIQFILNASGCLFYFYE